MLADLLNINIKQIFNIMQAKFRPSDEEVETLMAKQSHLAKQSFSQIPTLEVLTPSVISRQATINIGNKNYPINSGTIGHVAHGKSKVVEAISGVYV
jgi:hypothetical protein